MEHPGRETRPSTTPETTQARQTAIRIRTEANRWIQAKKPDDAPVAQGGADAELVRFRTLTPTEIATDVAARGFDLGDTVDRGRASVHDMAQRMLPGFIRLSQDEIWELEELIGEGVQLLSHAGLTQCTIVGADRRLQWVLTRRGRSAIADGSIPTALAQVR